MKSSDKSIMIIVVTLILTIGGCIGNAIHQEEVTKQLRIKYECKEIAPWVEKR